MLRRTLAIVPLVTAAVLFATFVAAGSHTPQGSDTRF